MQSWDDPSHAENRDAVNLYMTGFGNINSTGELGNYHGHAVSKWHPLFEKSLESGIKELTLLLVNRFGWITYTSCEGHWYQGVSLHPVERHVGLLPRSTTEAHSIESLLNRVKIRVNRRYWWTMVYLEVLVHTLESDGKIYRVIDLFFRRRFIPWKFYFGLLSRVYIASLQELERSILEEE